MADYQDTSPYTPRDAARDAARDDDAHRGHFDDHLDGNFADRLRNWQAGPLGWVGLVVAVFMAVPLLASLTARDAPVLIPAARAPAAVPAPVEPRATPAAAISNPVSSEPPQTVPAPVDATRRLIAKCLENGRVVYTQTGHCGGSVTALPIDTARNVVGKGAGDGGGEPRR